ncbi:MAG: 1-acyl-sn-glycerol-3-phosphate acyltransferase [Thermoanaerobaculales bacterium]
MRLVEIPEIGGSIPRRGCRFCRVLGRMVMRLGGWSFTGTIPDISKAVIIVAPHTSNWDFVIVAAGMLALDLDLLFLGKHSLFSGPLAPIMRGLGGVPVDRNIPGAGVVEQMVELFRSSEAMLLALSPEGTRAAAERWHMGFYHIAAGAEVPILPVALDYGRREIRFGPPCIPSRNPDTDLAELERCFVNARAKRNQGASEP